MAKFMIQISYNAEAWAAQISNPTNRLQAVGDMMSSIGVTFEHFWYSFGEYDAVIIADSPGNVEVSAGVLAAAAGGALKTLKTTPLITTDEMSSVLEKAGQVQYRAPSAT